MLLPKNNSNQPTTQGMEDMNDNAEPTSPYYHSDGNPSSSGGGATVGAAQVTFCSSTNVAERGEAGPGGIAPTTRSPKQALRRTISNISMPNERSLLFGSVSNLVNSIVGAGIIGIPYAISNAGFVVGVFLLVLVSILTDKTLRMLVELASYHPKLREYGVLTYEDLARIPFGRTGRALVLTGMLVLAYGAMLAYLLIIKDTIPSVLGLTEQAGKGSFMEKELPMIVTSLVIILPLSMMRDMASLEKTSFLSVLADVVLVGMMVAYSPVDSTLEREGGIVRIIQDNAVNSHLFIGLGVLSTAMACQHCAFIVSNSLQDLTPKRWAMVTGRSISISCLLCLLLGVTGYLGFLGETQGNILNNFDADSIAANAGRGLLAITMCFTYPMEAFVARHVLTELFYGGDLDGVDYGTQCFGRRQKLTLSIYVATILPACVVDDLGPVLSLTGAVGASMLAYAGAGVVYLGVNGDDFLLYCVELLTTRKGRNGRQQLPTNEDPKHEEGGGGIDITGVSSAAAASAVDKEDKDTDILTHCQKMLANHQDHVDQHHHPRKPTNLLLSTTSEVELSNLGNNSTAHSSSHDHQVKDGAAISSHNNPTSAHPTTTLSVSTEEVLARIRKPLWWYLMLFPAWTAIASRGAKGTRQFFEEFHSTDSSLVIIGLEGNDTPHHMSPQLPGEENENAAAERSAQTVANDSGMEADLVIGPHERDYYVSMFLISFGFLAAIVGVGSNIYVQVGKFFHNPPA